MPYQEPLARLLGAAGFNAVWTSLPGQAGAKGEFCVADVVDFLSDLTEGIGRGQMQMAYIAHCASSIGVLKCWEQIHPAHLRCLVAYGPLLNLARRRASATPRLIQAGVRFDLPDDVWGLDLAAMLERFSRPLLLAHSADRTNRLRANRRQIENLVQVSAATLLFNPEGYDDNLTRLPHFAEGYVKFLRSHLNSVCASDLLGYERSCDGS